MDLEGTSLEAANGQRSADAKVLVWIDQDLCTGDGICTDHAPEVFSILEDGIAYCLEGTKVFNAPGGAAELAVVPVYREADVIAAAAECPGECIFIEFSDEEATTDRSKAELNR